MATMTGSRAGAAAVELRASSLDAVVFDMDGVITDTAGLHAAAWKRTFDPYLRARSGETTAARPFDDADYRLYVDGKHRQDGVTSFLASRGIRLPMGSPDDPPDRETAWGLANAKNAAFRALMGGQGVRAFPSSVALVHQLQAHGIGTAIVSASRNCKQVLDAAGIGELFPVRVDGLATEHLGLPGKPSPAVFLEAAGRLGAKPDRAAIIEDALAGVEAGRAGRFALVVGVDRNSQADALRAHGADVVVEDLSEIRVVP